jgi:DNA-binding NarL/FixJ family response regulator
LGFLAKPARQPNFERRTVLCLVEVEKATPSSVLVCADRLDRRFPLASALERDGRLSVIARMSVSLDAAEVAAMRRPDAVVVESLDVPRAGTRLVARLREAVPEAVIVAVSSAPARPDSLLARSLVADRYLRPEDGLEALRGAVLGLVEETGAGGRPATDAP